MMYPEKLLRVELLFLGSDRAKALDFVSEFPRFHTEDIRFKLGELLGVASPVYVDEFIIRLEDAIRRLKAMRVPESEPKPLTLPADTVKAIHLISKQTELLYESYHKYVSRISEIREEIKKIENVLEIYESIKGTIPLPIPKELLSLNVRIGFVREVPSVDGVVFTAKYKKQLIALVISDKPIEIDGDELDKELFTLTIDELRNRLSKLSRELKRTKRALENRKLSVADIVEALYRAAMLLKVKCSIIGKGAILLESVYYVEGRVPKRDLETFMEKLRKHAPGTLVLVREPKRDETPPTLFRPKGELSKASHELTDVYGVTNYREINPSRVVLLTFPLFFGMMFADIAHGIILTLFGYLAGKYRHRLPESISLFGKGSKMIMYMGLRATFFGLLFGDFAGFEIAEWHIGEVLHEEIPLIGLLSGGLSGRLLFLQYVSIVIAVLHITRALILNVYDKIKKRDFYRAAFVSIPRLISYTLFIGPVGYLILLREVISPELYWSRFPNMKILDAYFYLEFEKKFLHASIAIASLMFLGAYFISKHHHIPFFDAFIEAGFIHFVEAFVTSLSNTVSYLRLLALNLAHMLLSTVFIDMGLHMMGGIPGIIIYIAGQILVLTIESISATLHAIRLHRVEFFSKLDLSRDGKRFQPIIIWV